MNDWIDALATDYRANGWCRVSLPNHLALARVRDSIEGELRRLLGRSSVTLDRYHDFVDDEDHQRIQWELVNYFWSEDCCMAIGKSQIDFFRNFIGPDLHIQRRPYLRVVRPNKPEDNIGFHRDTFYGQSPYEVAVHLPFLDVDENSCLKFLPGSQVAPETAFEIVSLGDAAWSKGSQKHEMGFPYAPKTIGGDLSEMISLPLKFGEALVFTPALVHGQEVNRGTTTRFSVDFRVVNSFAPVKFRTDLTSRGYSLLAESAVASIARRYNENCAAADAGPVPAQRDGA